MTSVPDRRLIGDSVQTRKQGADIASWPGPISALTLFVEDLPATRQAVAELKRRYARGEIPPAEFEVRLRSLTEER